ncbi:hypothetical protein [Helicobacter bizzozeronii]|uniref:hypothetical protein n=1 Tax=Helicobacter bizzozeronii TaxID=56877 RepID=UPI000CF0C4CF|nr:hypothetical protein [Helicobacter bizzozeronii]
MEASYIHNFDGFYKSLESLCDEEGDEEDEDDEYRMFFEELFPEDHEDDGKEFYAQKRQESLEAGAKAGSALCAMALAKGFLKQEDKDFSKAQELLTSSKPT